ncbi:hypothetical protein GWK47_048948 [Chionoecetes opilio]|uniref:Uncharacterized protein n=1 Tax=Chionoecetes opilio TaxID=41210 RepID=A0A8J5CUG0_CHIOP|nr:hypothetical protein GWK47_048948 [Chionoecetes opilio]
MDVDPEFPALSNKRGPPSPPREARKAPRSTQEQQQQPPRAAAAAPGPAAAAPGPFSAAPGSTAAAPGAAAIPRTTKLSPLGMYIIEGETRSLGNGSALVVALWERGHPQGAPPTERHLHPRGLAGFLAAVREGPGALAQFWKVGPLSEKLRILRRSPSTLRAWTARDIEEVSWIPPSLPRSTTGRWIRLRGTGFPFPQGCASASWSATPSTPADLSLRCGRCSGPIRAKGRKLPVGRPFRCFQLGGIMGPRSAHCPSTRSPTTVRQAGPGRDAPS